MHLIGAALALATALGAASREPAEVFGVVAVAPPPGPGPALVELTVQLRQRLAESRPGVLDGVQLRQRMGREPTASLEELDRAFEGARDAYARGDHEESVRTLRVIAEELDRLPDDPEVFTRWTRTLLRLARSEQGLGRDDAARSVVERLVRAAPDLEVDRALHPPRMVAEVERARAALAGVPRTELAVRASAPGARVFVDGREVGTAPFSAALPRGPHRLSGLLGGLRAGPVVAACAGEKTEAFLDFTIPSTFRPSAGPGLALADSQDAGRLVATGAYLRVDKLVAVSLVTAAGTTHLVVSLHDVRRGTLEREGRVRLGNGNLPAGGASALAEFLLTGRAEAGLVQVAGDATPEDLARSPAAAPAAPLRPGREAFTPSARWFVDAGVIFEAAPEAFKGIYLPGYGGGLGVEYPFAEIVALWGRVGYAYAAVDQAAAPTNFYGMGPVTGVGGGALSLWSFQFGGRLRSASGTLRPFLDLGAGLEVMSIDAANVTYTYYATGQPTSYQIPSSSKTSLSFAIGTGLLWMVKPSLGILADVHLDILADSSGSIRYVPLRLGVLFP